MTILVEHMNEDKKEKKQSQQLMGSSPDAENIYSP